MKSVKAIICLLLCLACISLCCCAGGKSSSLTSEYTRSKDVPVYDFYSDDVSAPENFDAFKDAYMDFAAKLLSSYSTEDNTVLSPLSAYTALAMTASGAGGKTLTEFRNTLAKGMSMDNINLCIHYLNSRVSFLNCDEGKLTFANSLWMRDDFSVRSQFLQTTANYYDAEVFRDRLSTDAINRWVSDATEGEIEEMLSQELASDVAAILINALFFEDGWLTPYDSTHKGTFEGSNGEEEADFMTSTEHLLKSSDAKAMIKSFANTPLRFVAILPDENISIDEYVASLSGAKLSALTDSFSGTALCEATLPCFESDAKYSLAETLKAMGIKNAFDAGSADFSNLTMSQGLYISDVMQNSTITISREGAKASSATSVTYKDSANPNMEKVEFEKLTFDRPFVFMIVDNESNLPVFAGTVNSLS